jgi:hypothetical protein
MSEEVVTKVEVVPVETPVAEGLLAKLREMNNLRARIADRYLALDQEKGILMATMGQVDQDRGAVFTEIMTQRGISTESPISVDLTTGAVTVLQQPNQPAQG